MPLDECSHITFNRPLCLRKLSVKESKQELVLLNLFQHGDTSHQKSPLLSSVTDVEGTTIFKEQSNLILNLLSATMTQQGISAYVQFSGCQADLAAHTYFSTWFEVLIGTHFQQRKKNSVMTDCLKARLILLT